MYLLECDYKYNTSMSMYLVYLDLIISIHYVSQSPVIT